MYMLRLGIISSLLSDALVSGFTTGAAMLVFVSQIKDLFGLNIPKNDGLFSLIYVSYSHNTYIQFVKYSVASETNYILRIRGENESKFRI